MSEDLTVRIGHGELAYVEFGPLAADRSDGVAYDFLLGPITVVAPGRSSSRLEDRNGVEPLALAHAGVLLLSSPAQAHSERVIRNAL